MAPLDHEPTAEEAAMYAINWREDGPYVAPITSADAKSILQNFGRLYDKEHLIQSDTRRRLGLVGIHIDWIENYLNQIADELDAPALQDSITTSVGARGQDIIEPLVPPEYEGNETSDEGAQFYELRPPRYAEALQKVEIYVEVTGGEISRYLLRRSLADSLGITKDQVDELLLHLRANKQLSKFTRPGAVFYSRYDPALEEQQMAIPITDEHYFEKRQAKGPVVVKKEVTVKETISKILQYLETSAGNSVTSHQIQEALEARDQIELPLSTVHTVMRILMSEEILSLDLQGNELKRDKRIVKARVPDDVISKRRPRELIRTILDELGNE